jgi:hypothetical protein
MYYCKHCCRGFHLKDDVRAAGLKKDTCPDCEREKRSKNRYMQLVQNQAWKNNTVKGVL